ncbi:MAG: hypothetical protein IJO06_00125 [Thermoguttaceae bacterium]|nr:hypothetical protein [Thermoguttaceae bacterium]
MTVRIATPCNGMRSCRTRSCCDATSFWLRRGRRTRRSVARRNATAPDIERRDVVLVASGKKDKTLRRAAQCNRAEY